MENILKKAKIRNDYLTNVIRILVQRRKKIGLSQEAVNAHIGVTDKLLAKWETGIRSPTSFNLYCWADALDMKLTVVANDNIPPEPEAPSSAIAANDNSYKAIK